MGKCREWNGKDQTHAPFDHTTFHMHTSIHTTTYHSVEFIHSFVPQLLDNFLPPSSRSRKNPRNSKPISKKELKMTSSITALVSFFLLLQLPVTRMAPLRNAKPQVRVSLLFAEIHGFTDSPREGAANDASDD